MVVTARKDRTVQLVLTAVATAAFVLKEYVGILLMGLASKV